MLEKNRESCFFFLFLVLFFTRYFFCCFLTVDSIKLSFPFPMFGFAYVLPRRRIGEQRRGISSKISLYISNIFSLSSNLSLSGVELSRIKYLSSPLPWLIYVLLYVVDNNTVMFSIYLPFVMLPGVCSNKITSCPPVLLLGLSATSSYCRRAYIYSWYSTIFLCSLHFP